MARSKQENERQAAALAAVRRSTKGRRLEREPEIWGAAEAAEHLGVQQPNLRTIHGLPEPYQEIRMGKLWRADDIRDFMPEFNARASRKKPKPVST
jgi:hypothetical protein